MQQALVKKNLSLQIVFTESAKVVGYLFVLWQAKPMPSGRLPGLRADTSCTTLDKSSSRQSVLGTIYKINLAVINIWHFS